MQVGRTTAGLPGCEFPSRRQVAISHAQFRACDIFNAAYIVLYSFRIRLRELVFLPESHHAQRSHHARATRVRIPRPAASGER